MRLNRDGVLAALSALADQWEELTPTDETLTLVVCGGSALQVLGLVEARTTRDVDVLALATSVIENGNASLTLLTSEPLPQKLVEAAERVARDFTLPANWLNSGPTDLLTEGLPDGFSSRLHPQHFGATGRLTILFADRVDQICLKMYAAVNGGGTRHLTDLRALHPTDEELLFAALWTITQDAADFFPELVRDFLRQVGYGNVADRF